MTAVHLDQASQGELAVITALFILICVGGAVWARRKAPAVSVGLVGGLVTGLIAFFVSSANGQRGVPQNVVFWFSVGLAVCGLLALFLFRSHTPAASLWRAPAVIVICAPLLGLLALVSVQHACPLYVGRGSGFCYYQDDVLGGWSTAAFLAITFDTVGIAFLVWFSAWRSRLTPREGDQRLADKPLAQVRAGRPLA